MPAYHPSFSWSQDIGFIYIGSIAIIRLPIMWTIIKMRIDQDNTAVAMLKNVKQYFIDFNAFIEDQCASCQTDLNIITCNLSIKERKIWVIVENYLVFRVILAAMPLQNQLEATKHWVDQVNTAYPPVAAVDEALL
ncbi:uncharacterized protein BT62DRAFT_920205 [Guyanagaster necrorhizus]|uniref:Uncharacterized protein n=1 Tax=Guyanagaster necrorhizus TaxID=856835 RepID=A0A9P7VSU6_9AGAR|nr:uncharacterized protein BT62DRAFT_920205 [Guyanagaster necrorhizus MCA 3950]KAG7446192.1 hypothetical protein BT62DRAFT_920205 [Guyanagaster necrorhizus MCA 3950]